MPVMMQNKKSGSIKMPIPHIPDLHTTTPLFGRECKVMVF
jgi:hypothetical protein